MKCRAVMVIVKIICVIKLIRLAPTSNPVLPRIARQSARMFDHSLVQTVVFHACNPFVHFFKNPGVIDRIEGL